MKTHTEYLHFNTAERIEFIHITDDVQAIVNESGIKEGLILINPMHITASVYINDHEGGLIQDYQKWLKQLAPMDKDMWQHNLTGEDNAYAHLWRTIMGRESTVAITEGKLDLGTWERLFYAEFDGQRDKRVLVKIIGE
ncbi:secondary thiamine-phosphate synthase enzyme YjbQ [Patescibacteria group bacterium]|nr:secondary thiamine-phosphate synthase enzyme YjbQ [Patescibacteria group bacterium]MBU1673692.1 secondary thiamine-phosphate synthase enzyme YjbQ [Patescibacteria group bacterium]MBU1963079.1 secondary thiamine-phosphate synthase enzyme YjbQ [Patescibacteria group bacterium]